MDKKIDRHLKCILTEEELKQAGEKMAQAYIDLESEQDGLKAVQAQFKARISEIESQIRLNANKIQNGFEYRSVQCEAKESGYNIDLIRMDTFEVVESRPMTSEERQQKIDFEKEE